MTTDRRRMIGEVAARVASDEIDECRKFYDGARSTLEAVRSMKEALKGLPGQIGSHLTVKPGLSQNLGYLRGIQLRELNCQSAVQTLDALFKQMDQAYSEWKQSGSAEDPAAAASQASARYDAGVNDARNYLAAYEKSCADAVRNRFVDDEENVSSLLDGIRDGANYVLNNNDSGGK